MGGGIRRVWFAILDLTKRLGWRRGGPSRLLLGGRCERRSGGWETDETRRGRGGGRWRFGGRGLSMVGGWGCM